MSSVVISGDTSGTVTLQAPAVAGSSTQNLVAASGTLAPIVSGTSVATTSGTALDLSTSIPSWATRITVMLNGVSTNGTSAVQIQVGSSTYSTSGYSSVSTVTSTTANTSAGSTATSGFHINSSAGSASSTLFGHMVLTLLGSNTWIASHTIGNVGFTLAAHGGGAIALSGTLDRIRITTVNGTDTFDAGSINIMYE